MAPGANAGSHRQMAAECGRMTGYPNAITRKHEFRFSDITPGILPLLSTSIVSWPSKLTPRCTMDEIAPPIQNP